MTQRTLRGTILKKIRVSGFLTRMRTKSGQKVIKGRRKKARRKLTV